MIPPKPIEEASVAPITDNMVLRFVPRRPLHVLSYL